jgi:hypothetical protein
VLCSLNRPQAILKYVQEAKQGQAALMQLQVEIGRLVINWQQFMDEPDDWAKSGGSFNVRSPSNGSIRLGFLGNCGGHGSGKKSSRSSSRRQLHVMHQVSAIEVSPMLV